MSAVERVRAAYRAIAAARRPEIWIHLRAEGDALADAAAIDARRDDAGPPLPLAGLVLAVKNNVDVAGLPTTAGCPDYATAPADADAPVVARLRAAGAVVIGATNLDQFATGLVGTRSPYGAVRDARVPERISGGSSSGSAVAVALGLVDVAIGTDTAGSGRVPAALQGIVGIKPTVGVVPVGGVVPACRSYDCVTVLARDTATAEVAMGVMAGSTADAPARAWPADTPLAARPAARVAVPAALPALGDAHRQAFRAAGDRLVAAGAELVEIDLDPFLEAATLLYGGGLVAERHAAVGAFVDTTTGGAVDPTVGSIISAAGEVGATRLLHDRERLEALTATAMARLEGCDALLVPTTTHHPTIAEVAAEPVAVNSRLGTYTNFCNLMDLCAVAVPSGTVATDRGAPEQFGVTVVARAGADALALDLARRVELAATPVAAPGAAPALAAPDVPWPVVAGAEAVPLFVCGAHLRGQPLAHQLDDRGARWTGPSRTAARYRLTALDTVPPKPGLVPVGDRDGTSIGGGTWLLRPAALGDFLAALPAPMTLGRVELADGAETVGFGVRAGADGEDISAHGDWPTYLASVAAPDGPGRAEVVDRVWRRRLLRTPDGDDTTTEVTWLQLGSWYCDLRQGVDGALEAFAGRLRRDRDGWTWRRDVDLLPPQPLPDRGTLHLDGEVLVETGIGRDYREDWRADPVADGPRAELVLRDPTGALGLLLRLGPRFGYVRADAVEVSLGTVEGDVWRVERSSRPDRVGTDLAARRTGDLLTTADGPWLVSVDHPPADRSGGHP